MGVKLGLYTKGRTEVESEDEDTGVSDTGRE
jgi:hypothetical protein